MNERPCSECGKRPAMLYRFRCCTCEGVDTPLCGGTLKLRNYQQQAIYDAQLIEVGNTDKRKVTPLNKELYDLARDTMTSDNPYGAGLISKNGHCWHIGFRDVSEFINELEKRYDITPKQDTTNA
ncbi:hypothetical protein NVP1250O_71 [Vibrio phage 1.250.O._10N.261.55.E11]|nr:hypothetical protein NVP1250O_71 [Vibrio phage 1.250.O._10N.261.55.E11]